MTAAKIHRPLAAASAEPCPTCASPVATPYCATCGEQRASDRHYTLGHLGAELVETITHADGRALRTVRALVARPGELTAAYMRGARRPYLAPLQFFFLVNIVFFLWVGISHTNMFGTPLQFHVQGAFYSDLAQRLVSARLAARHVTYDTYAAAFNHAAALQSKSLIILMVPLLAVLAAIITLPVRRPATQHVVFALHVMTAVLLLVIGLECVLVVVQLMLKAVGVHPRWQVLDQTSAVLLVLVLGAYVHRALRRAYQNTPAGATIRAVLFAVAFIPVIFLYRAVLFFTTFYTT